MSCTRSARPPAPPLNLVGDFGGGSAYLIIGVLAALSERERSGLGQTVDAAIVDGVTSLDQGLWSLRGAGGWTDDREANLLDGAAPFYGTYTCADARYVAVGAIEPQFYTALLRGLDLGDEVLPPQHDRSAWPVLRARFGGVFATRPRDAWIDRFASTDACVTPVLTFGEAAEHPHLVARATLPRLDGIVQAAPAPRFSRSVPATPSPPPRSATRADAVDWTDTHLEREDRSDAAR